MAEHTPGPWEVFKPNEEHGWRVGTTKVLAKDVSVSWFIASTPSDRAGTEEANARLIAAAPELLQACMTLLAVVDRLPDGHSAERITSAIAARQAIAKAKGRG